MQTPMHAITLVAAAAAALLSGCANLPDGSAPGTPPAAGSGAPGSAPPAAPATPGTAARPAAASPTAPSPAGPAAPGAARPAAVVAGAPGTPAGSAGAANAAAANPAAAAMAAAAAAARAGASAPQPAFAEVVREAKRTDGFFPIWTKDDRTWIEIPADRLNTPFFLATSNASGIGDLTFAPGLTRGGGISMFRRVGNTVQLLSRNQSSRATEGTPLATALQESYTDSLQAAVPLAAAPHPDRRSLLIDAAALLGNDLVAAQTQLEGAYRLPYTLDRANTVITRSTSSPASTSITVRYHFSLARLPSPAGAAPGGAAPNPAATPNPPRAVPDPRSLFLGYAFTMAPLPAQPMAVRKADPRVGYFVTSYTNLADDASEGRRTHMVRRWRLEKKDPAAEVSEPKEPIRVVMDRNIPVKWRPALREGILEWNKAFERAGFRNAISLEQQPDNADWSTLEGTKLIAVRWFVQEGPGSTAVGPSQSDPRTGEQLRGAAIIDENRVRVVRASANEVVPRWAEKLSQAIPPAFASRPDLSVLAGLGLPAAASSHAHAPGEDTCTYGEDLADDTAFTLDLLAARGELDTHGPQAEQFINDALKAVTMHEIGHVLGLRHNFRASASLKLAQLRDADWVKRNGLSPTVMEYLPTNMPLDGEPMTAFYQTTLGAYDYWAIEYGYRQWADAESEKKGLAALLAKADTDPMLVYATDEDLANNDPLVHQRDLGEDPLAWAHRQLKLSKELFTRTTTRPPKADEDQTLMRRAIGRVFSSMASSLSLVTKSIGGFHTTRVSPTAGKPLIAPVPAAQQRAALDMVLTEYLGTASFRFDPALMGRLGVDHFERSGAGRQVGVEFSIPQQVGALQRGALDALMADTLAGRLADSEAHVADARTLLSFSEVQEKLSNAVWSELKANNGVAVDSLRRNLQREYVKRLAAGLVRPAPATAADVRAVHRQTALRLQARLQAALSEKGAGTSSLVRAHLEDSLATISEALKAPLVKQGA